MKKVTSDKLQATSEHLIALSNSKPNPGRGRAYTRTLEDYDQLVRQPWLKRLVEEIRQGDETKKSQLPFRAAHYYAFKDNHRAQKDIIGESFTHQTVVDVDDPDYVERAIRRAKELNHQEGLWKGMLMHMEYSARRKLHIDIRIPRGMSIEEAQQTYCQELGVPYDASCTSPERFIYLSPIEDEIYRSEEWYRVSERATSDELQATSDELRGQGSKEKASDSPSSPCTPCAMEETGHQKYPTEYKGIPYADILKAVAEELGGEPTEGERNAKVLRMASSMRHICDNNPEWLMEIIPTYGLPAEEWRKTIQNACKDGLKYGTTKVLEAAIKRVMSDELRATSGHAALDSSLVACSSSLVDCPPMPQKLPPLIELLTRNVPEAMKAAVAHAVFPPLGAHLGGVKFRYIDNVEREATFMCVLLAKMSSGKSAVNKPIELIMKDIVERDALNRLREQEWKASLSTKGANKEKPKRPEGLCIQMLVPDMTNAAFVQRLADAQGKFLYTQMDELELLNNLKTSARGNQVSQIIRLAFDQGLYGQERVGAASVTAMVPIRWNWNASATIERGRQFFRTALTDGTLSRLNFCTIPPQRMGEIPVYGTYNAEYEAELKPYIDRLNAASGLVECAKAEALAHALLKESAEVVMLTDDEVYEMLSHRANVIAYLKAMTLYIAHGYKWSKTIEEFVRWSKEYDLWCKMHFYGKRMQEEVEKEIIRTTPGRANMLEMLPERFTRQQLEEVRVRLGKERDATEQLSKWRQRGYVTLDGEESNLYVKSEKYKKRGGQWTMDN